MNEIKDGGPAFPIADPFRLDPKDVPEMKRLASGMTLRDYFAAKAMSSFIAGECAGEWEYEVCAMAAYRMADAMLRARGAA
ncbi:putative gp38 [Burkholderia pseudomallei]|uniref:hypothetical protein n=1 Tax=Burkholderia pseudomallei TaxID=28450 RepID=UPI0000F2900D|nr:hypothetical protein [Burkholderia pseudomallei]ABN87923.1 gp38 [Burkholderia pseudomallei 668]AJX90479.1 putative gp38 [Burkholderia pseudomallei]